MTDHAGGLRGNLAGPVRAMVRNRPHKLDEDKGSPGYIMARAKSQRQLERRQLLEALLAHLQWGDEE